MKSLQKINNELIRIFLKIPFSKFKPFNWFFLNVKKLFKKKAIFTEKIIDIIKDKLRSKSNKTRRHFVRNNCETPPINPTKEKLIKDLERNLKQVRWRKTTIYSHKFNIKETNLIVI